MTLLVLLCHLQHQILRWAESSRSAVNPGPMRRRAAEEKLDDWAVTRLLSR